MSGESVATLNYDGWSVSSDQIRSYWYRRGALRIPRVPSPSVPPEIKFDEVISFLNDEAKSLFLAVNLVFEKSQNKIGSFLNHSLEKIKQLSIASETGLEIPRTLICTENREAKAFLDKYGPLATKGIKNNFNYLDDDSAFCMYTSLMDDSILTSLPESYFPTLYQSYVNKKYELRIFYLHTKIYAMAIFSQSNENTKLDFRRYDFVSPNRNIPYQLPKEVEKKIILFMQKCGLDTGSIDMVVTEDGRYVFLEVNPDGQFGMVSQPCNYFIEREIANILARSTN